MTRQEKSRISEDGIGSEKRNTEILRNFIATRAMYNTRVIEYRSLTLCLSDYPQTVSVSFLYLNWEYSNNILLEVKPVKKKTKEENFIFKSLTWPSMTRSVNG